jgi:hypothetical protein
VIEIRNLEVRFDVDGSDEDVFARLFTKFIAQWSGTQAQRRQLESIATRDRSLGDRATQEEPWL